MKLLVAIMTCHKLDYYINDLTVEYNKDRCLDQQARVNTQRETWLKEFPDHYSIGDDGVVYVDYKFFYGQFIRDSRNKPNQRRDTLEYPELRAPLSDEIFLPIQDGYVHNPAKLRGICEYALANGYDYILRVDDDTYVYPTRLFGTDWHKYDYSGSSSKDFHPGGCVFLSRKMMEAILRSRPNTYADDVWVGKVASDNHIPTHQIPVMHNKWGDEYDVIPSRLPIKNLASFHSCKPEAMKELHAAR